MPTNIEMPKLSDTMTEGTLVKWNKKTGDTIEIGDVIAEIETDKATMEMEAFDEGILSQILVQEGSKAAVGATLGILLEEGETAEAPTTDIAAPEPAATPTSETPAPGSFVNPNPGAIEQTATPSDSAPSNKSERIKATPLARKLAAAAGIDLSSVKGTGPGGRIVKSDIEGQTAAPKSTAQASALATAATSLAASAKSQSLTDKEAIKPAVTDQDQTIQLSTMRSIIADRLLTSKTTIPHFYLHMEADTAALMNLRKQINAQAEQTHGNKYSINDFILKAVINSAQAVPEVNASYNGDNIIQFAKIGVAVAIAVEDGLVTPVIKDAANKPMLQISQEVKDLAARARDKKLMPNEFDGGTLTVSNLGAWGIENFDAIINPPQAIILSIGAIVEKPVVKDGQIVPGMRMDIGISCDHRVVDGAVGAKFLAELKKLIENPALMLI